MVFCLCLLIYVLFQYCVMFIFLAIFDFGHINSNIQIMESAFSVSLIMFVHLMKLVCLYCKPFLEGGLDAANQF